MAAVHINQLPFFSAPRLYMVSRGSWKGMEAEITWIMNNYYLKLKNMSLLCSLYDVAKNCSVTVAVWFHRMHIGGCTQFSSETLFGVLLSIGIVIVIGLKKKSGIGF